MELLNNFNLKYLSHDLIIDGSESFYDKIPDEYESPIVVDYPYPIELPSKTINSSKLKQFFHYCKGDDEKKYLKREFDRMKSNIVNQDFKKHAILPEFLINSIQDKSKDEIDYGFNIPYSYGVLEKFYNDGELCLIRPRIDNNLQICKPRYPEEKIILQWICPDPIRSIRNMDYNQSNNFILRGQHNLYLIEIKNDYQINIDLRLKCDVGYLEETLNHLNKIELALMNTKAKLKLFDLREQKVISTYTMEELYFESEPKILKMNYLTENMLMIMTDKHIKVLDNRCKDAPQEIDIKLENCDMLLDFSLDKDTHYMTEEVYLSSKHAVYIYDIRGACVNDYIHHNLRFPPCFIKCLQGENSKLVSLFSQSAGEAALFGTLSSYSLPYHLITLEDTLEQCRSRKKIPPVPNAEERLNYPVTGVQMVPNNGDVSIYFCNVFGEIFRQDILLRNARSEEPFERMYQWLTKIYETSDSELNVISLASPRKAAHVQIDFNDVDIFNLFEKTKVHDFLADEEFEFKNWNVDNFDEIWNDENSLEELRVLGLKSSPAEKFKVEEWISNTNFESSND